MKIDFKSDFELMKIPIIECKEKLVNLRDYSEEIIIEIEKTSKKYQNIKKDECFVRESVAIMLSQAQSLLPKGVYIKVIDGFRSLEAQKKIYQDVFQDFKKKFPNKNNKELKLETDKWVANPKTIPPHTTGGAVDLILVDKDCKELDMGAKINTTSVKAYTHYPNLSKKAKENRALLIRTMKKVGFVNYPLEYWHWSYGDRIWAYYTKKKFAIYGVLLKNFSSFHAPE